MALSTSEKDFGQKTLSVVEVDTDQFILEDGLSKFDAEQLELALEEASLDDYTIPSIGITADEYFAPFIYTEEELTKIYTTARVSAHSTESIIALEQKLDALEARVEELETP